MHPCYHTPYTALADLSLALGHSAADFELHLRKPAEAFVDASYREVRAAPLCPPHASAPCPRAPPHPHTHASTHTHTHPPLGAPRRSGHPSWRAGGDMHDLPAPGRRLRGHPRHLHAAGEGRHGLPAADQDVPAAAQRLLRRARGQQRAMHPNPPHLPPVAPLPTASPPHPHRTPAPQPTRPPLPPAAAAGGGRAMLPRDPGGAPQQGPRSGRHRRPVSHHRKPGRRRGLPDGPPAAGDAGRRARGGARALPLGRRRRRRQPRARGLAQPSPRPHGPVELAGGLLGSRRMSNAHWIRTHAAHALRSPPCPPPSHPCTSRLRWRPSP